MSHARTTTELMLAVQHIVDSIDDIRADTWKHDIGNDGPPMLSTLQQCHEICHTLYARLFLDEARTKLQDVLFQLSKSFKAETS